MSALEDAWAAVHDALPAGWTVGPLTFHVEDDRWHVLAADHRPGRRPDYIESVGIDEAHCLRGLGDLLRVWRVT